MPDARNSRRSFFAAVFGGTAGLFFLGIGLNRPSIAEMRTVDLVHLLATGAFFGVALVATVVRVGGRRKA